MTDNRFLLTAQGTTIHDKGNGPAFDLKAWNDARRRSSSRIKGALSPDPVRAALASDETHSHFAGEYGAAKAGAQSLTKAQKGSK